MSALRQPFKDWFAPTDEQLMWRVQTRDDSAAFATLVGRWQEPIRRLATRLTGDPNRAEDLAQEVFSKLFARRHSYATVRKFSTWLWRVAVNHCYNDLRRLRSRPEGFLEFVPDDPTTPDPFETLPGGHPAPDEQLAGRETADAVRRAVLALPEGHRSIVVLRHYEGLKLREIAEVLDLPEGTVKTRLTEALAKLARLLNRSLELNLGLPPDNRTRPNETLIL